MCWDCWGYPKGDPHKIFTQGGVPISDFDDEVKYRHPPRKVKKVKPRRLAPGCIGNDDKAHVYVWTSERETVTLFYRYFGYHPREHEVCVGCGRVRKGRPTEKYEKRKIKEWNKRYEFSEFNVVRGVPVSRPRWHRGPSFSHWRWESYDEGFQKYKKDYIEKYGYTSAVWGY